jgi:hypothetical protein
MGVAGKLHEVKSPQWIGTTSSRCRGAVVGTSRPLGSDPRSAVPLIAAAGPALAAESSVGLMGDTESAPDGGDRLQSLHTSP